MDNSGHVVEWIFDWHILPYVQGAPTTVLDLTWGRGVFWDWNTAEKEVVVAGNDVYSDHEGVVHREDFTGTKFSDEGDDVVVFDPPFTASGHSNKGDGRILLRYGAVRGVNGGPTNIHEVQGLLRNGIREACRLSARWVLIKTQDVVESGVLHPSTNVALNTIVKSGFNILLQVRFSPHRRPQPKGRRVTGLGNQPSVFILAERNRP